MGSVSESKPGFTAALAFGALWGAAEATLGHLLHAARIPGLAGFVMFPLALFLLARAYGSTGRLGVLPAAAAIAASVKLVDAFLPGSDLGMVLNPALAVFLEGLAATALLGAAGKPVRLRPLPVALAALSWRLVFLLVRPAERALAGASNPWTSGAACRPVPLLLEAAAATAVIMGLARFLPGPGVVRGAGPFRLHPAAAAALFGTALAVEVLL